MKADLGKERDSPASLGTRGGARSTSAEFYFEAYLLDFAFYVLEPLQLEQLY